MLYAERFGVIEAAQEKGLFAFGNMSDQIRLAPDTVVTSLVWNMTPTVEYVINQVEGGTYTAQDLKDFSMVAKGGASLAPIHTTESKLPADLLKKVRTRKPTDQERPVPRRHQRGSPRQAHPSSPE